MTCIYIPNILLLVAILLIAGCVSVLVFMYADGYWSPDRVHKRWLFGDSFTAIDERHALGINRDGSKIKKRG